MKRLFALLFVGLLVLSACSSGSSSEADADTNDIKVWAWDPNFNIKAMELAKTAYQQENTELNIEIIENAQDDIIQKLNTSLSSGTTKGLPNIVLIEDYRAQSFLQSYPDMFYAVDDSISTDDFAKYKIPTTSFEGKQYGVPFDSGVAGLYVRTDYLEEAGYSIEDLQNTDWEKVIEIGKAVKDATGKQMLTQDPKDLGLLRMMIQSSGAWYLEEDGVTPDIADNEALKEAFRLYKEMIDADLVKPHSDWSQFIAAINNGDIAMVPSGNWITPSIKAEASQSGKWAVAPFPKLPGIESVNASNLGGSSWYVLNVPGKEKAAEFLGKTFGANVDYYQRFVEEVGGLGTYQPAADGEAYQAEDEFFGGQKILSDFAAWTEEIPQVNYGLHTYVIEDILANEIQKYLDGEDLDTVLENAQSLAEQQAK
ncbi:ABC transporter substrate-binding protein [Terribacillus sp. 7520-G]|uniref:ABC transporter substrate-binding protein n=1 Tax=Terribacillus sp. 7520-G TaxID=2025389 RepID=UPI000BA60996|nr:extracellular solute-binding protein [Terribacillus sp. 7520-G]PAD40224.1 ABC transporter substrate-binding protein [Terribacillus sp. 7520-G]